MRDLSIRGRLVALIVLTAMPALGLTVLNAARERAAADAHARQEVVQIAQLAALHQDRIVESTRQTLIALSQLPPELRRDRELCTRHFAAVLKATAGRYHSMGIHNADGTPHCSAVGIRSGVNAGDAQYFKLAMQTGKFAVGDYQIGPVTGKPSIYFGHPVAGDDGGTAGVAFVALDLQNFNRGFSELAVPLYARLTAFDRNGVVLARSPDEGRTAVGEKLSLPDVLENVLSSARGTFDARGTDGQERLFAYVDVATNPDGSIPVSVLASIPKSVIYANADATLKRNIAELLLVTLLLIALAWYGAERLVLDRIRTLLRTSARVREGDLGARTGMANTRDELKQIGYAFDEMAQALQQRQAQLDEAMREMHEQATTDTLTGLHNRRYFRETLSRELTRARRSGSSVALIMSDLDHFKRINDTFGHGAGDLVLRSVGELLRKHIRAGDVVCRFGGEEFMLILPDATRDGARLRAEALRMAVGGLELQHEGRKLGKLTASFGVALFPEHAGDADALVRAVDEALYAAKGSGRDRVALAGTAAPADTARGTR